MLTEGFITATLSSEKISNTTINKDVGIFQYEYQPRSSLKSTFKKSSTKRNCVAITATHIFAAQADKAVINVYSRDRGNQEALIPFSERIGSVAYVGDYDDAGTLAIGTEEGRILLWELGTGRVVSTPAVHLQSITCLIVDQTRNFLLSGSLDSSVHVWSIPELLSFSTRDEAFEPRNYSPRVTFSTHRGAISCLATSFSSGSAAFAVSGSEDKQCILWDFQKGDVLHVFQLPLTPLCLALDPADRAFYVGLDDGSVQVVEFSEVPSLTQPAYDELSAGNATIPDPKRRWPCPYQPPSPTLCVAVCYDGTAILTGHQNGKISAHEIATARDKGSLADLNAPVTNLHFLPPTGFPTSTRANVKLQNVVRPQFGGSAEQIGPSASRRQSAIPHSYTFTAQFTSYIPLSSSLDPYLPPLSALDPSEDPLLSSFSATLRHPVLPDSVLNEALSCFLNPTTSAGNSSASDPVALAAELEKARAELANSQASQRKHAQTVIDISNELIRRDRVEQRKRAAKAERREQRQRREELQRKREAGRLSTEEEMEMDREMTSLPIWKVKTDELGNVLGAGPVSEGSSKGKKRGKKRAVEVEEEETKYEEESEVGRNGGKTPAEQKAPSEGGDGDEDGDVGVQGAGSSGDESSGEELSSDDTDMTD